MKNDFIATKRKFYLNGEKIQDLDSFFHEVARQLFPDVTDWDYNFDGFDDVLGEARRFDSF